MHSIREYDPERDAAALRACFAELQDFERALEPEMLPGASVAGAYVSWMLDRCRDSAGKVFVAEAAGRVVGFVCVWAKVRPTSPDEPPTEYAYVSDLVVLASHRGRGLGRALLGRAERYAREQRAPVLRIGVLAANAGARRLYLELGFAERYVQLSKRLDAEPVRRG